MAIKKSENLNKQNGFNKLIYWDIGWLILGSIALAYGIIGKEEKGYLLIICGLIALGFGSDMMVGHFKDKKDASN